MDTETDTKERAYLQLAEEADRKAQEAHDPEAKRTYREIAEHWRAMAQIAKRNRW
ncbi:MAG: hypothetical protein JO237_12055 [Pseudolabrys sp.]|nr:hypothetical protein [Pseudolabrys sp.]